MTTDPCDILLNGRRLSWAQACRRLRPGLTRQAVTAAGGLLLQAAWAGDVLAVRLQPHFVDGRRTYHYDMPLPDAAGPALRGDISPNGTIRLLIDPTEAGDHDTPAARRRTCILTARALHEGGLDGRCPLSEVARAGLVESGLFDPCPGTLAGLAYADGAGR